MALGPYPTFGWSMSRHRTLHLCSRRYYYDHYGSWNGWDENASMEARLAYRLKKLEKLDTSFGSAIHRRAYELTTLSQEGGELPSIDVLRERSRTELGQIYRTREDAFVSDPKGSPMLHSFYYGNGPTQAAIDRVREKLEVCHRHLREQDLWEKIREWEVQVRFADDPDDFADPVVHVDGVPVFGIPDLVIEDDAERLTVVDWKTGRPREGDEQQIAVYGLFVRERYGVSECRGRLVYLNQGHSRDLDITAGRLDEVSSWISYGIAELREFVADPDLNRGRPKTDFPLVDDREECKRCNYFELCREELLGEGPLPWERDGNLEQVRRTDVPRSD